MERVYLAKKGISDVWFFSRSEVVLGVTDVTNNAVGGGEVNCLGRVLVRER